MAHGCIGLERVGANGAPVQTVCQSCQRTWVSEGPVSATVEILTLCGILIFVSSVLNFNYE